MRLGVKVCDALVTGSRPPTIDRFDKGMGTA